MMPESVNRSGGLTDLFGRRITYLRVSLTERCNLRCRYCYGTGKLFSGSPRQLTSTEILRLIRSFATLGISKIRFTGGEPLLRPGLADLIRQTSAVEGITAVGLTTNGLILEPILPSLIEAGLNRLNISLDTLNRDTYRTITGTDGFDRTFSAIDCAEKSGAFDRVKVNTVVMRGINDDEIRRFALWALNRRIDLRFIEFMPAASSGWGQSLFVGEDIVKDRIGLDLEEELTRDADNGPAKSFRLPNAPGRISFISAISRCFCGDCNRLRLTSRGDFLGCLFFDNRVNIRYLLEGGADVEEIAGDIRGLVAAPGFKRAPQNVSSSGFNPFMRKVGG